MLIVFLLLIILQFASVICFRLIQKKRVLSVIFLITFGLSFVGSLIVGMLYGKKLFALDDPHLGGWIFLVAGLLSGFICCFILLYRLFPLGSKIVLGIAFVLLCILFVMCIYEAKVIFANGINSNSPNGEESSSPASSLIWNISLLL